LLVLFQQQQQRNPSRREGVWVGVVAAVEARVVLLVDGTAILRHPSPVCHTTQYYFNLSNKKQNKKARKKQKSDAEI
jgi:hypothetical protein